MILAPFLSDEPDAKALMPSSFDARLRLVIALISGMISARAITPDISVPPQEFLPR
jgi:hypothetical protein